MNYSLDTPTNRKVYVPGSDEKLFEKIEFPKIPQETDQTHRNMTWLFHKPQNTAIFPIEPMAVKIEKKK